MMFRSLGALAVLLMTTSLAQAAFNADDVAAQLQSDGFTRVEIKIGPKIAKVEAIKGTTKIEVTYDIASGTVLKTETETVDADDNTTPGVQIRNDDDLRGDDDAEDDRRGSNSGPGGGNDDDDHRHGGDDDDDDHGGHGGDDVNDDH